MPGAAPPGATGPGDPITSVVARAFDAAAEGVVVLRAVEDDTWELGDFAVDYANAAALVLAGRPAAAPVPERLSELFPDAFDGLAGWVGDVARTHQGGRAEAVGVRGPDGAPCNLELRASMLDDGRVLVMYLDASGRRRLLAELRASRAWYQGILDQARDLVMVRGPDGRLRYASAASAPMLGHAADALVGAAFEDLVHPEDRKAFTAFVRDGGVSPAELRVRARHRDGSWRWLALTGADRSRDPAIGGMVISARDIDAVVVAEAQARLLSDATDAIQHGFIVLRCVLGDDGGIASAWVEAVRWARPGFEPAEDVVGTDALVSLPPGRTEPLRALVAEALRRVGPVEADVVVTLDEGPLPLRARAVALGDGRVAVSWRDLTDLRARELELAEARRQVQGILVALGSGVVICRYVGGVDRPALLVQQAATPAGVVDTRSAAGRDLFDLFPALVGSPLAAAATEAVRTGTPVDYDHAWEFERGAPVPLALRVAAMGPDMVVVTWREATDEVHERRAREDAERRLAGALADAARAATAEVDRAARVEAERRLHQAVDVPGLCLVWVGTDGRIIAANTAYGELVGWDPAALAGRSVADVAGIGAVWPFEALGVLASGGTLADREMEVVRPDGSRRWVLANLAPRRDEDGRVVEWLGRGVDVTARRRAEQALAESEARLRSIVEGLHAGFAVFRTERDPSGSLTSVEFEVMNPTGLPNPDRVIAAAGHNLLEALPGFSHPEVLAMYTEALDAAEVRRGRFPVARPGGVGHLEVSAVPVGPGRVAVTWRDVTDEVEARQAAQDEARRLRGVLDAGGSVVVWFGPDGRVRDANGAFAELMAEPVERLRGRRLSDLVGPGNTFTGADMVAVLQGRPARRLLRLRGPAGDEVPLAAALAVLRDGDGNPGEWAIQAVPLGPPPA